MSRRPASALDRRLFVGFERDELSAAQSAGNQERQDRTVALAFQSRGLRRIQERIVGKIGEHRATESLQWIAKVGGLVAERPLNFTKKATAAEKKLLQIYDLLEKARGG